VPLGWNMLDARNCSARFFSLGSQQNRKLCLTKASLHGIVDGWN
jgi:hypothetical protein